MKSKTGVALLCCFLLPAIAEQSFAQPQPRVQSGYRELSATFFQFLEQDKAGEGIDFLFETNPALKQAPGTAEELKTEFAKIRLQAGPYITHSLLVRSRVAGMYVYEHYFVAYDLQPVSLRITYYRRDGVWVCQGVKIDTDVDEMLQSNTDNQVRTELEYGVK